jgi:hypothetical protein
MSGGQMPAYPIIVVPLPGSTAVLSFLFPLHELLKEWFPEN